MTSRDRIDAYMSNSGKVEDQRGVIFKAAGIKQYRYQYNPMDSLINQELQSEADREDEVRHRFLSSAGSGCSAGGGGDGGSSVYTSNTGWFCGFFFIFFRKFHVILVILVISVIFTHFHSFSLIFVTFP